MGNDIYQKRDPMVKIEGRALYLSEDADQLQAQLEGTVLTHDPERKLIDNISTDEITPGWVCFWYDETLGEYSLIGLRGGHVKKDSLKCAKCCLGLSKGCGSSRETAPFSEKVAGIELVVAKTIEKIYGQNCRNIGLLTTTDFSILERIEKGEAVPLEEFTTGLDPIAKGIVEYGGLFNYNKARLAGQVSPPPVDTKKRPMNLVEKIIARSAIADAKTGATGIDAVKPGDALFCRADVRFSHEYVTPMGESFLTPVSVPTQKFVTMTLFLHSEITSPSLTRSCRRAQEKRVAKTADNLAKVQEDFVTRQGIRLFGEHEDGGSEAICHNAVMEELAAPGFLVIGTDSHTCTAGALGCFAFGVGSTDMANAWYTKDVQVKVPESVRYDLVGKPAEDITAKDVILYVMAQDYIKSGKGIGKVLEFTGEGLLHFNMDERATLTNMAVEAGATTGIIEPDAVSGGISHEL